MVYLEFQEYEEEKTNAKIWIYFIIKEERYGLVKNAENWEGFLRINRFKIKNIRQYFGSILYKVLK